MLFFEKILIIRDLQKKCSRIQYLWARLALSFKRMLKKGNKIFFFLKQKFLKVNSIGFYDYFII